MKNIKAKATKNKQTKKKAIIVGSAAKSISVAPFGLEMELMSRWRGSLRPGTALCQERHTKPLPFRTNQTTHKHSAFKATHMIRFWRGWEGPPWKESIIETTKHRLTSDYTFLSGKNFVRNTWGTKNSSESKYVRLCGDLWPIDAFHHDEDLSPGSVGPGLPTAYSLF